MTALDNHSLGSTNKGTQRSSRLTLNRGKKRNLHYEISPAPEPRSSHRIRTNSSGDMSSESSNSKTGGRVKNSNTVPSSSPTYRAAQLGLRKQGGNATSGNSSPVSSTSSVEASGAGVSSSAGVAGGRVPGVCPLANLGNTCFLNSVLYALRFLPGFTHDLHHLHTHLQAANCADDAVQHRVQFLSELHSVFVELGREERSLSDAKRMPPLQPYHFLQALRVVNPMFEGNRQQDAHELLHCLLDQLCHLPQDLNRRGALLQCQSSDAPPSHPLPSTSQQRSSEGLSPPHKKARRRSERIQEKEEDHSKAVDVVGSKFVGRMCLETCCSECEKVTGREETFLEVCVPVKTKADFDDEEPPSESEVFMSALCEEECLQGNNKYWCDACSHHNEARRSVHYPQLPHHLLIHVKRFSAYSRNMFTSKCSDAMPAPLQLSCFCRSCISTQLLQQERNLGNCSNSSPDVTSKQSKCKQQKRTTSTTDKTNGEETSVHLPYHLSAMVCHLGASLSSGHYITYVRVEDSDFSTSCPESQSSPSAPGDEALSNGEVVAERCEWSDCCALKLDQILPNKVTNGLHSDSDTKPLSSRNKTHNMADIKSSLISKSSSKYSNSKVNNGNKHSKNATSTNSSVTNACWLECDDEKIKLVYASEVMDKMRGTLITPYLLFYSRLSNAL